ncbi:hypothetical protein [Paraburkholderia mimosarum]|uniref:hypothetical protein n=1 Tax=Paraburkholderia mimosarum TaxID=312026 RepID=UPI0004220FDA|nr:hypothetical protein [Paraburkholderia mimosarum]
MLWLVLKRGALLLAFAVVGVVIALSFLLLTGCTLIYIEGDGDSVRDIGGHTGTLSTPAQRELEGVSR